MSNIAALKGGARGVRSSSKPGGKEGPSQAFADRMFAQQNEYKPGTKFRGVGVPAHHIQGPDGPKEHKPLPFAMTGPSRAKDRLALKHKMMNSQMVQAGAASGNIVNWSINDSELDLIQGWRDMVQYKNFVTWLFKKYDLAKPGMLNFVKEMYPEIIEAQMSYIDQQAKLNSKILKLKAYGPQDKTDHELEYMLQTGQLTDNRAERNGYIRGMLNPSRKRAKPPTNWWNVLPDGTGTEVGQIDDFFPTHLNTLEAERTELNPWNEDSNPRSFNMANNPPVGEDPGMYYADE